MMLTDITDLQRLLDAATPAPWRTDGDTEIWEDRDRYQANRLLVTPPVIGEGQCGCDRCKANIALIPAMRNALPAILAELEAARELRAASAGVREHWGDEARDVDATADEFIAAFDRMCTALAAYDATGVQHG